MKKQISFAAAKAMGMDQKVQKYNRGWKACVNNWYAASKSIEPLAPFSMLRMEYCKAVHEACS